MADEEKDKEVENQNISDVAETVSKEAYEQVKSDMHKFKTQYKEKDDQLLQMQSKIEQLETTSLKERKNYKELYERAKEKETEAVKEATSIKQSYLENRRLSEIEKVAIAQGMDEISLELLRSGAFDTSSVITETTSTGRVNVLGADDLVEGLKKKFGTRLFPSGKAPIINSENPNNLNLQDQPLTSKDLLALQSKDPKAYKEKVNLIRMGKLKLQGA